MRVTRWILEKFIYDLLYCYIIMDIIKTEIVKEWNKLPLYLKGAWIGTVPLYVWFIYLAYYMIKLNSIDVAITSELTTKLMSLVFIVPFVLIGVALLGAFTGFIVTKIPDK